MIGDEIRISIVSIEGDRVRLGIDAPRDVSVHREEIFLQIIEENQKARLEGDIDWEKLKNIFSGA